MARVLKDVMVVYNSVNLSTFCKSISLTYEVDEKEVTTFPDSTHKSYPTLKKWRVSAKLNQSFLAGEVDATLFPLLGDPAGATIAIRVTSGGKTVSNPEYTGNGILFKYPPITGGVGDIHETDIDIGCGGDLTRTTS